MNDTANVIVVAISECSTLPLIQPTLETVFIPFE